MASTTTQPSPPGTRIIHASADAANVVGGITESFLGGERGVTLSSGELDCLSNGASSLTAGVMDTAGRTAQTFKALQQQTQVITQQSKVAGSPLQVGEAAPVVAPPANPVDPLIVAFELSQRLAMIMEYERKISRKCLKSDARKQIEAASHHLSNVTFTEGRLVANGVDIVTELGEAIGAYDDKQYRAFGDKIGLAARKVLLSEKSDALEKLFHTPSQDDIEETTSNLVRSLFQGDMHVQIATDGVTTWAPLPSGYPQATPFNIAAVSTSLVPWMLLPASEVNVDLHQCIVGNQALFNSAYGALWSIMGKLSDASTSIDMPTIEKATGEGADGFGLLATSLLDVQIALRRCGFNAEQEAILMDSIEAGKGFHSKLAVPKETLSKAYTTKNVAGAVDAWENERYGEFGKRIGTTLRELLIETFPGKYEVNGNGALRREVIGLADKRGMEKAIVKADSKAAPFELVRATIAVAAIVPSLLLVAILLRAWRAQRQECHPYSTLLVTAEVSTPVFDREPQEMSPV